MPHIHTEPGQHDSTVGAYIIVQKPGAEPALLLHRHKKLNCWLQPGGHVELDENPWDAVIREVTEETGYAPQQLKVLQPPMHLPRISDAILHPYPVATVTHRFGDMDHYHTDTAYAFVTDQPPAGTVGKDESTHLKTFTATEMAEIPSAEIPENVREISLFVLQHCLEAWQKAPVVL